MAADVAASARGVDRVNALVHDAWRVAAAVLVDPARARPETFLAGARAARAGAALLRTLTPSQPEERWFERAARVIELGADRLQMCAELSANLGSGVRIDVLMRHCEQAEGDFDFAWELIARDSAAPRWQG